MLVNEREEGLVGRAEPLELAEEISHSMVEVERLVDGALLLDVDPSWARTVNAVLVTKGVRVSELTNTIIKPGQGSNPTRAFSLQGFEFVECLMEQT